MPTHRSVKQVLHQQCLDIAEERIQSVRQIMKETQSAANNETKSSSGDKHETGRAMAQLEIEKLANQLRELQNTKQKLTQINPNISSDKVLLGSVIYTDHGNFYLAASIGKLEIEDQQFFVVSAASPIGKLLIGKKAGENFLLNGKAYSITAVI
jgi:transcription elongation GreA/GreB family factor